MTAVHRAEPTGAPTGSRSIGPLTRTDLVRFAGASGDFNPVHHDDEYARGLGFPSVFSMGMLPAGMLGAFVGEQAGQQPIAQLDVRFVAPVWPGDTLVLEVADLEIDGAGSWARLGVSAGGQQRLTGAVAFGGATLGRPAVTAVPQDERLRRILGTRLDPVHLPVERGKIMEYARSVRAGVVHLDLDHARAAGYSDLPAPPMFTVCAAHWSGGDATAVPRALGLDLASVLHAEQRYTFHRTVVAGDVLYGERTVTSAWTRRSRSGAGMLFVTVATSFVGADGAPAVDEELVMLERGPRGLRSAVEVSV